MKLYTDIVTDYLAGRSLAAHAQEWFFTQPGYYFQEPDGSDAQKAAVRQVYEQVLRTVETFVPGNRPVWDALFPDWQDILRGAETALIVGYPPPNDAVVLKSPPGWIPPFWTWACGSSIWAPYRWSAWRITC